LAIGARRDVAECIQPEFKMIDHGHAYPRWSEM
jgi:hypothetical protein